MAKGRYKVTVIARNQNGATSKSTEMVDANSESEAQAKAIERMQRRYPNNSVWVEKVEMQ
jgi:1,2-phenylacetyl-CoA epoxidase PaaB subunit